MRTLVIGGAGLIGARLVASLESRRRTCLATCYSRPMPFFYPLDIRDGGTVHELIAEFRPEVTYLAAGISSHAYAAAEPEIASDLIVGGAETVAQAVRYIGGRLIVFSGDGVFGECNSAKRETDPLAPAGELAELHARMEGTVRTWLPDRHLIVRTSRVFGESVRRMARKLESGETFQADNCRLGQPTYVNDLAEAVVDLVDDGHTGTIHITGAERHTDFTFARLIAHLYGYDADMIEPRTEIEGLRPTNVWLDRFAARRLCGPQAIRPVADAIRYIRDRSTRTPVRTILRAA